MRIGILGAGAMAAALGTKWAAAGHDVMVGARDVGKAEALASKLDRARAGTFADAAGFGEVVLVAVAQAAVVDVVRAAHGPDEQLAGRVLVDCTVPISPDTFELDPAGVPSVVEQVAAAAPQARVVKAFNICAAEVYAMTPPAFDGVPLAVPICGDDAAAVALVGTLAVDLGCTPMPAGGLSRAALMEAASVFVVGLWFTGADAATILPPLRSAFGALDRVPRT